MPRTGGEAKADQPSESDYLDAHQQAPKLLKDVSHSPKVLSTLASFKCIRFDEKFSKKTELVTMGKNAEGRLDYQYELEYMNRASFCFKYDGKRLAGHGLSENYQEVICMETSDDFIAIAYRHGAVSVLPVSGLEAKTVAASKSVTSLKFSPDGELLLVGGTTPALYQLKGRKPGTSRNRSKSPGSRAKSPSASDRKRSKSLASSTPIDASRPREGKRKRSKSPLASSQGKGALLHIFEGTKGIVRGMDMCDRERLVTVRVIKRSSSRRPSQGPADDKEHTLPSSTPSGSQSSTTPAPEAVSEDQVAQQDVKLVENSDVVEEETELEPGEEWMLWTPTEDSVSVANRPHVTVVRTF